VEAVDIEKPSVSEMEKVPMRQKAAAFLGATGMKAPKNRGRAVKDCRRGGHRPAQAKRGRLGGDRVGRVAPILDGTGESPSELNRESTPSSTAVVAESQIAPRIGRGEAIGG
jgi:hypothetical protein